MHPNDSVAHLLVFASLYAAEDLDGYPLFLALHQGGHDLCDAIHVQGLWLDVVDILFIIFTSFLLTRSLGDRCIPAISIIDAKSLDGNKGELGRPLSLGFATNISSTVGLSTVAWLRISSVSVDIIIEDKLLACPDFALGEDSHTQFVAHDPLVNIAVRVTGMIAKATQVAFLSGINKLVLCERHEIEVFDSLIIVLNGPLAKVGFIDDFPNVLKNEIMSFEISVCS